MPAFAPLAVPSLGAIQKSGGHSTSGSLAGMLAPRAFP